MFLCDRTRPISLSPNCTLLVEEAIIPVRLIRFASREIMLKRFSHDVTTLVQCRPVISMLFASVEALVCVALNALLGGEFRYPVI